MGSWQGLLSSPKVHFTSKMSQSVPQTGWKEEGKTGDTMRVNLVSKAFTWDQVLEGEEDKEEGVFCDGINGQRLLITRAA